MAEEFEARLEIQANRAIQDLAKLREALEDAGEAGTALGRGVASAERALAKATGATNQQAGADRAAAKAARDAAREYQNYQQQLDKLANTKAGDRTQNLSGLLDLGYAEREKAGQEFSRGLQARLKDDVAAEKRASDEQNRIVTAAGRDRNQNLSGLIDAGYAAREKAGQDFASSLKARLNQEVADERSAANAVQQARKQEEQATRRSQQALEDHYAGLSRTRYALYDVSGALAATGVAMTALGVATAATAITMERQFADVVRTLDADTAGSVEAVGRLRDGFNELYSTQPINYQDLTAIGTLAGQLNVAEASLVSFTSTAARLSTTTDVSVEAGATALARLNELLPDVNENYESLASGILAVGTSSIATESQIVAISTQISSLAAEANLTSADIIGLSGALASVGVAPELARGTLVRLFGTISRAIDGGGESLQTFSQLSGRSAEQFASDWRTNGGEVLQDVFEGLNRQGANVTSTLASVGITASRDIPVIGRLAQNYQLLGDQTGIAADAISEGTELQRQYSIISATTQERLNVLVNNFNLLVQALGSSTTAMGPLIDVMSGFLQIATRIAENPLGGSFAAVGLGLVALIATFALGSAAIVRFTASSIAARQAAFELTGQTNILAAAKQILANRVSGNIAALGGETTALRANTAASGQAATASGAAGAAGSKLSGILGKAGLVGSLLLMVPALVEAANYVGSLQIEMAGLSRETEAYAQLIQDGQLFQSVQGLFGSTGQAGAGLDLGQIGVLGQGVLQNTGGDLDNFWGFLDSTSALTNLAEIEAELQKVDTALAQVASTDLSLASSQFEQLRARLEEAGYDADVINKIFDETTDALSNTDYAAQQSAASLEDQAQAVSETVSAFTDGVNASLDFNNALYSLGAGLGENGAAFDYFSEAGRTNIGNVIAVMDILAAQAGGDAAATANSLQGLYNFIIANTGIAANEIAFLANTISSLGGASAATSFDPSAFFNGFSSGATKAAKSAGRAARSAAKEIRTLVDYANDLNTVFSRSFDIRFGGQMALDDIASSFNQIAEENQAAREAIMDYRQDIEDAGTAIRDYQTDIAALRAEMQSLTADRSVKEYFLDVANAYSDTLRAGVLRGEISEIDADLRKSAEEVADAQKGISDEQKEIQKANKGVKSETDKLTRSTDGNSQAAIDNRAALYGLVGQYQGYIQSLAASGADQNTLNAAVARSREQFIQQARQLGFTDQAIDMVVGAFGDMRVAIDRVPRNITVSANINPALQALNEFVAKARQAGSDAGGGVASGVNNALANIKPNPIKIGFQLPSYQELMRMQDEIRRTTGDARFRIAVPGGQGGQVFGAAHGGFVPGPTPSNLNVDNVHGVTKAGVPLLLQGGEPIINNSARRYYGDAMFNAINSMKYPKHGFASGGFVPSTTAPSRSTGQATSMPMIDPRQLNQLIRAVQNATATLDASPGQLNRYTDQGRMAAARQGGQG